MVLSPWWKAPEARAGAVVRASAYRRAHTCCARDVGKKKAAQCRLAGGGLLAARERERWEWRQAGGPAGLAGLVGSWAAGG